MKAGSSLTPEAEEARRLLEAAASDLRAAKLLSTDAKQSDAVIGFHAQQAVEKALKAVLASEGSEIPYTHDLSFLIELASRATELPGEISQADWLTPWAVAARYGAPVSALDRQKAVAVATAAVNWAQVGASDAT